MYYKVAFENLSELPPSVPKFDKQEKNGQLFIQKRYFIIYLDFFYFFRFSKLSFSMVRAPSYPHYLWTFFLQTSRKHMILFVLDAFWSGSKINLWHVSVRLKIQYLSRNAPLYCNFLEPKFLTQLKYRQFALSPKLLWIVGEFHRLTDTQEVFSFRLTQ